MPRRIGRAEGENQSGEAGFELPAAAETLRAAGQPAEPAKPEEKISVFWRVFGGTILSIVALIAITLYTQINNSINELRTQLAANTNDLRNEVTRVHELHGDFVKKDEHASSRTKMWDRIQELQAAGAAVTALRERVGLSEEQVRAAEKERRQLQDQLHALSHDTKDKLTAFAQQLRTGEADHKELQALHVVLTSLQEKSTAREEQVKKLEEERRELRSEVQQLRERLAKLEGQAAATAKPAPKATPTGRSSTKTTTDGD